MAGPNLSSFLGFFRLRDATDPSREAAVGVDGSLKVAGDVNVFDSEGNPFTDPATTEQEAASAATLSSVNSTASNTAILAADPDTVHVTIYNSDENALLIKYGATASASSFTYRIRPGETWDMPYRYVGQIDGIWEANGAGTAFITKLTRS